ncbi:unnamed protein product [Medioppia subpectinata]|uniref:Uncharacterized protein n=1 Tax=Medioppia subpectinata TaxID=1979941 RepID=A0A7R9PV14_9ACAR|nr:unnamed protein product [Medioppia subpectinata]CAG2101816.1 unnamed protein product [Medioppia subpectinata]
MINWRNEFVGGIERIYFDKTGKQIAAPKESVNRREAENFYSLGDLVKAIDITVFINIGKCMIGCIVKAHLRKQCMKIVSCFWACITNRNEDPTLKKVVELTVSQRLMIAVGMVDDPRDQNRTELERHDVVKFAACGGKCLIVHLPQGINNPSEFSDQPIEYPLRFRWTLDSCWSSYISVSSLCPYCLANGQRLCLPPEYRGYEFSSSDSPLRFGLISHQMDRDHLLSRIVRSIQIAAIPRRGSAIARVSVNHLQNTNR